MKMSRYLFILVLFVCSSAHALPVIMGNQKHRPPKNLPIDEKMGRTYHVRLDFDSPRTLGQGYGGSVEFGYLWDLMGADMRVRMGSMQLQSFFTQPTEKEITAGAAQGSILSPDSEINRTRNGSSNWTYTVLEPGVSVTGQMLPTVWFKNFTQTARFGVGRAYFKDSANGYSFAGWVVSPEALIRYHASPLSHYTGHFGFNLNWGSIARSDVSSSAKNETSLPVHYTNLFVGMAYSW